VYLISIVLFLAFSKMPQPVPSSVGGPSPSLSEIVDWCKTISASRSFRCNAEYRGASELSISDKPTQIEQSFSICVRWPDSMMLDTNLWQPGNGDGVGKANSASSFIRLFRSDGSVSSSTDGDPVVVSPKIVPFSTEAWRYCHFSPWLVAQIIANEDLKSVLYFDEGRVARIVVGNAGIAATFELFNGETLRLIRLQILSTRNNLDTTYEYSDFRNSGPSGQSIPWAYSVTGRFKVFDRAAGKVRLSEPQALGSGRIVSCGWPEVIPTSDLEFPNDILKKSSVESPRSTPVNGEPGQSQKTKPKVSTPEPVDSASRQGDGFLWLAAGSALFFLVIAWLSLRKMRAAR
jgi:hypothetical protein